MLAQSFGSKMRYAFGLSLLTLAGCESKAPEPTIANSGNETLPPEKELEPPEPAPKVTLPACEAEAPSVCAGPLIGNVENVTLQWNGRPSSDGRRRLKGTATLTLAGRVAEPLQVALLRQDLLLKYANGTVLTVNSRDDRKVSGLSVCGCNGQECINKNLQTFSAIAPGDSPVRVDINFDGFVTAEEVGSLAKATTASLSVKLWVVHTDPAGNQQTVSVGGIPVANSTVE
jgi:hypothetical protein